MQIPDINPASATWIIAEIGALNWGLQEAFNFNIVTELLGSGSAGLVYVLIGLAGAIALADDFDIVDLMDS